MSGDSFRNVWLAVAAVSGFATVAAGAFGAHGLKEGLHLPQDRLEVFDTGVRYQIFHTLALAVAALLMERRSSRPLRAAAWSFLFGIIVFSGSLYVLALSGVRAWAAVTPFGGLSLLAGWALLTMAALKR